MFNTRTKLAVYTALHYLDSHPNESINPYELEQICFYSYRQLQRLFKSFIGESIGQYQQRQRIENAKWQLLFTQKSIITIAQEVGYENGSSLSKEFVKKVNMNPSEYRNMKYMIYEKITANSVTAIPIDPPDIVDLAKKNVWYDAVWGNYESPTIESLWSQIDTYCDDKDSIEFYGVIGNETLVTQTNRCRYDACFTGVPFHNDIHAKEIFGGRYARFYHIGGYGAIDNTYNNILVNWIFPGELKVVHKPVIEQYILSGNQVLQEEDQITAIYFPLEH